MEYPLVNGSACSFAEMRIAFGTWKTYGFKSFNFSESVERGKVRGTGQRKLAMTAGDYDCDASFELYKADADEFLKALGDGYMNKMFNSHVDFAYLSGGGVSSVEIQGAKLKKIDESHSQGTDALTVKFDLDVMSLKRDKDDAMGANVPA